MPATIEDFEQRLEEAQSGALEVSDFSLKNADAFPSAEVLVPAPMAVSIFGQLTLIAATTDFKLVKPEAGFKYVQYPESFRATISQLVNAGCLALNRSYANFDEIRRRSGAVRPGVNNIVQLLVGSEDNTPQQNERAIERHLPNQIRALSSTIDACLVKAQETDRVFGELLELTMEVQTACTVTRGDNEARIRDASLRQTYLEEERKATENMRKLDEEELQKAREDMNNAQSEFHSAVKSMPSGWDMFFMNVGDAFTAKLKGVLFRSMLSRSRSSNAATGSQSNAKTPIDRGYKYADVLRKYADTLDTLLTPDEQGRRDWDAIKSPDMGGCHSIRVGIEQKILKRLQKYSRSGNESTGEATSQAIQFGQKGIELADMLEKHIPSENGADNLQQLQAEITTWRDSVLKFATEAALNLDTSGLSSNGLIPDSPAPTGGRSAEIRSRDAQFRVRATEAQLNASRERSRAASEKLREVTSQLGDVLGQIAGIDVQKRNWEDIIEILKKAITFLCELKRYLNNLVHFFTSVKNLVSITMRDEADRLIQVVKDEYAITDGKLRQKASGVTLDAWARQSIYNHALSTAKISRIVENISDMYVTLYNGHVHPGVNMVLGMGGLIGSNDTAAIAAAGEEIKAWAAAASDRIVHLVSERMQENERDIEERIAELERTLGSILPQTTSSARIQEIVKDAEEANVKESIAQRNAAFDENPIYGGKARSRKAKLFV